MNQCEQFAWKWEREREMWYGLANRSINRTNNLHNPKPNEWNLIVSFIVCHSQPIPPLHVAAASFACHVKNGLISHLCNVQTYTLMKWSSTELFSGDFRLKLFSSTALMFQIPRNFVGTERTRCHATVYMYEVWACLCVCV